jgi:putative transposase
VKVELSVAEAAGIFKEIATKPEKLFEMIRVDVRESVGEYLSEMMGIELTHYLGRDRYERVDGNHNHRNGFYRRSFTIKGLGEVRVRVPRDRDGEYQTAVIPRSKQYEDELRRDLTLLFLGGISTRTLSMLSRKLIGRRISPAEVSNASRELIDAAEEWRNRNLSGELFKYLFIDGVCFDMRVKGSIESVPVLVVIGVTEKGCKRVLGLQRGDKESASTWRELFKDLKKRGLNGGSIMLGVMDGLPGLEKVFREEFPKTKTQRCQVHVARNVLAKVPKKLKQAVADDMRSIFYASSRDKARELFLQFKSRWGKEIPSAVKCLENSIDSCLTFFDFPEDEWISLRTTNIIERLNKEFKRRTKPMEIIAGEDACYILLAFISLKMELHWRANPIGKVRKNLPFFQNLIVENFTQNS